jgi:hypothetical protein
MVTSVDQMPYGGSYYENMLLLVFGTDIKFGLEKNGFCR